MILTNSAKFTASSAKNPCPVCGRTKDGDCRLTGDGIVFCHTHQTDRKGDTRRGADGQEWACVGNTTDGAGWGIFKIHEPLEQSPRWQKPVRPKSETFYYYPDRNGNPLVRVKRIDRGDGTKTFSQERWDGSRWQPKLGDLDRSLIPVYRYKDVKEAIARGEPILWVEGEQTADLLWKIGIAATTSIGGSGGFTKYGDYSQDVAGASLVICPDRDPKGIAYAEQVARYFGATQWIYAGDAAQWDNPGDGYDLADWISDLRSQGLDDAAIKARILGAIGNRRKNLMLCPPDVSGIDLSQWAKQVKSIKNEAPEVTPELVGHILAESQTRFDICQLIPTELANAITRKAKTFELPPETLLTVFLTVASSLISHKLYLGDDYTVPAILWLGLVGDSGTGKSPLINTFTKPLVRFQTDAYECWESAMESYRQALEDKGIKDKPSPPNRRFYYLQDFTWESISTALKNRNHCLIYSDELAGFVLGQNQYKARGGNDRQRWLTAYDGGAIDVLRTTRNFHIPDASLSVLGGIQPSILQQLIGRDGAKIDGFWARFIWVEIPNRRLPCPIDAPTVNLSELLAGIYERLDQRAGVSTTFRLCPQGKRLWVQWWDEIESLKDAEVNPFLRAIYPKALERAGRIALVAHCVNSAFRNDCSGEVIPPKILEAAIAFVRWTLHQARMVYGDCGHCENPEAQRIARFVQRFAGKTVTGDTVRSWWPSKQKPSRPECRSWLADLVALGYGAIEKGTPDQPDFLVRIFRPSSKNPETPTKSDFPVDETVVQTSSNVVHRPTGEGASGRSGRNSGRNCRPPETATASQFQASVDDGRNFNDSNAPSDFPVDETFVQTSSSFAQRPAGEDASGRSGRNNGRNCRPPETATASQFQASVDDGRSFDDSNSDGWYGLEDSDLPGGGEWIHNSDSLRGEAINAPDVSADAPTTGAPETTTGSQFQGNAPNVPTTGTPENTVPHTPKRINPVNFRVGDWVRYRGDNQMLRVQCEHSRRDGVQIVSIDGETAVIKSPKWIVTYPVSLNDLVLERRGGS